MKASPQPQIWLVGLSPTTHRLAKQVLGEYFPTASICSITTPAQWEAAHQAPPPDFALIEPHAALDLVPEALVAAIKSRTPACRVLLLLPPEQMATKADAALAAGADEVLPRTEGYTDWLPQRLRHALRHLGGPGATKDLLAQAPVVLLTLRWSPQDDAPHLTFISPSVVDVLGYTPQQVLQTPHWFLANLHPEDRPVFLDLLRQKKTYLDHLPPSPPFRFRHGQTGAYRWLQSAHRMQRLSDGTYLIHLAWMDITDHTHLHIDHERLLRHLNLLHTIDRAILSAYSASAIAQQALEHLHPLLRCDRASVVLFDHSRGHAVVLAAVGTGNHTLRPQSILPLESFQFLVNGKRQIYDISHSPRDPIEERLYQLGIRLVINIPLRVQHEVIGALNLGFASNEPPDEATLRLVEQVADQLAIALQQAQLREAEFRARQAAEAVQQASIRLGRSLDPQVILDTLLDTLADAIPYASASVFLREDTGQWQVAALRGYERFNVHETVVALHLRPLEWATLHTIISSRRALVIGDTYADPRWQHIPALAYIRSWMGIPLVVGDEIIGFFALDHTEPFAFTPYHLALAEALAAPAAIALQNARLFQREQQRRQELEALRDIALRLTQAQDPQRVLEQAVVQAMQLTGSQDVHIFLYKDNRLKLGAAFFQGSLQHKPLSEPRPEGVTYTVARTGQPMLIPRVNASPFYRNWQWGGSLVSLPIRFREHVLGVLNVAWPHPYGYTEDHLRVLHMLADQVAVALANANLVSTLRQRVHELNTLVHSALSLREASESHTIAATLSEQACLLLKGHAAALAVSADPQHTLAVVEGVHNLPADLVGHLIRHEPPNLFHTILQSGRPFLTSDLSRAEDVQHPAWLRTFGPAVGIPLRTVEGETLGALVVVRHQGASPFDRRETSLLEALGAIGANAIQRARAFEALETTFLQTVLALARAMDARDSYTGDHSQRLAEWALAVAEALGLDETARRDLYWAALLHDIGKLGVPDDILLKPAPLTSDEWEVMRKHPVIGAEILRAVPRLERVAEIVQAHHERWDGSGYPRGLRGEEIPLEARILAVVDSYGAMIDERVYRPARSHEEAIDEIRRNAGKLYDPRVVDAFLEVMEGGQLPPEGETPPPSPLLFPMPPPPPDPENPSEPSTSS